MSIPDPVFRRLRGYSFDPSLSAQLDTALVNEAVFKIDWEESLKPGPIGEYLEIVDYDPASKCFYEPVDLNDKHILAQDGLSPSEGNPQFHQQMTYAVAMTTITNFEKALGRKALWSPYRPPTAAPTVATHPEEADKYVQRLRIYPHALRQANAYYSPAKKALLFGYFPAVNNAPGEFLPNGLVFTCLSHDIIAHETTHALLDGMHRRFVEASHRDTLAFHEAFADIVALFQHFSFPEVLKHQIAKTRGRLESQNLLGELAQQFGKAIGQYGALRDAIGTFDEKTDEFGEKKKEWKPKAPDPAEYQTIDEPHKRGALLVAAVFDTFLAIYKRRVADLLRISTSGTGVLPEGELHPDLVNRLANEAAKCSKHILNMCIRALDYCPPVDISFGDYLRAIVTADIDLVPNDEMGYRIALIDAFKRRGIYPRDIRTLSPESLSWERFAKDNTEQLQVFKEIAKILRKFVHRLDYLDGDPLDVGDFDSFRKHFKNLKTGSWQSKTVRERIFILTEAGKSALSDVLVEFKRIGDPDDPDTPKEVMKFEEITGLHLLYSPETHEPVNGLEFEDGEDLVGFSGKYTFEVHSLRGARRVGPDGNTLNQVIISITQYRTIPYDKKLKWDLLTDEQKKTEPNFKFRGGCTLILDLQDLSLRYAIVKNFEDKVLLDKNLFIENERLTRQRNYRTGVDGSVMRATYFGTTDNVNNDEPFALLHRNF
ncbi:MAG: hypothetical protein ACKVRN_01365 [Pyrinomonadaceae bacterium]